MYHGKYRASVKKSRKKRIPVLLISLVLLAVMTVSGALAYLMTSSGAVKNTFRPGEVKVTIQEDKTSTTKSNIQFTNPDTKDAVPVYVRATLAIHWEDTIGGQKQIVAAPAGSSVTGGEPQSGWTREGDIYYYNGILEPGEKTPVMASPIVVTIPKGSTAECIIEVRVEAIQADGMGAASAKAAWNAAGRAS